MAGSSCRIKDANIGRYATSNSGVARSIVTKFCVWLENKIETCIKRVQLSAPLAPFPFPFASPLLVRVSINSFNIHEINSFRVNLTVVNYLVIT